MFVQEPLRNEIETKFGPFMFSRACAVGFAQWTKLGISPPSSPQNSNMYVCMMFVYGMCMCSCMCVCVSNCIGTCVAVFVHAYIHIYTYVYMYHTMVWQLLAAGCWQLAAGCWLLAAGCSTWPNPLSRMFHTLAALSSATCLRPP